MAVTPADLLSYAESLIQNSDEIRLRNGAGRAFYAGFHACRPLAARLGTIRKQEEGTHQWMIRAFKNYRGGPDENAAKEVRTLGKIYWYIRDLRSRADYDIDNNFKPHQAQQIVETTKRLMVRVAQLESAKLG